ncbi:MAG: hypothetical protein JW913_09030 [Chitinispirillaceae bacterium]|nr:hypothetical protein [Chitinispirillaceae bacterium]
MIPIANNRSFLRAGAVVAGMMFSLAYSAQAAPAVTVGTSFSQEVMTVTMTASAFPELRSVTFDCAYDPQRISIMDGVVGSPLPATALGVAVDTAAHSLRLMITAASTVTVGDGKTLVTLLAPMESPETGNVFTVSEVAITDKNGTVVNATIHSTAVDLSRPAFAPPRSAMRKAGDVMGLQLNGRRFFRDRNGAVPGYIVRRTGHAAMSGMILIR